MGNHPTPGSDEAAMPTLVLPPRYSEDSNALWRAAIALGWDIERMTSWRAPEHLLAGDVVLYGEQLFAETVAQQIGLALIEPRFDWLVRLPPAYVRRDVRFMTLDEARACGERAFYKPAAAIDVGIIEGRGWAVVEANAAWASGIYGCNAVDVLDAVRRSCRRPGGLSREDRAWILDRSPQTQKFF